MDFSKKRKADENGTAVSSLTAEDSQKLLQLLTQEQLLNVLHPALLRHSDVLDSVRAIANRDTAHRKLFVRGLAGETTSDSLRSIFSTFGELEEAIVIFDKVTLKSKGYGFVTFKNADSALLALRHPSKKIDGRITVTQFAAAGNSASVSNSSAAPLDATSRKIYVGNVPFEISSERLLSHFMMYGEIEEGPLGFDKSTGKSRGFAFFIYRTEEATRAALVDPLKTIDGHQIACKLAVDNKKTKSASQPANPIAEPAVTAASTAAQTPFQAMPYRALPQPQGPSGLFYPGQVPPNFSMISSVGNVGFGPSFAGAFVPPPVAGRLPASGGGSQFSLGPPVIQVTAPMAQQPPMPRAPPGGGMYHYY